jgi:hypothetical protein
MMNEFFTKALVAAGIKLERPNNVVKVNHHTRHSSVRIVIGVFVGGLISDMAFTRILE